MVAVVALLIATLIPLLCAYGMYALDIYQTRSRWYILYCFLWGGTSYVLAVLINRTMIERGVVSLDAMLRFSAPVVEEILKGTILFYLVRKMDFTYFVDGAIYGFAAGIGFAIIENYEYVLGNPGAALVTALARVFSTNLIHAAGSGMIGISLGAARLSHSRNRVWLMLAGLGLAFGLHLAFNNLVTRVNSGLQVVFAVIVGLSAALFIFIAIRRGLQDEKAWIEERLGMQDRVTAQEAAVVNRLEEIERLLQPLVERFGPQKMAAIEQFMLLQARLGILRKTLEVFQSQNNEKMAQAVQAQMETLRRKIDQERRSIGAYYMLYLRHTFLQSDGHVLRRLQSLIDERQALGSRPDAGNLWSSLDQRIRSPAQKDASRQDE